MLLACVQGFLGVGSLSLRIHQHCTGFFVVVALRFTRAPQIEVESHLFIVVSLSPLYNSRWLFTLQKPCFRVLNVICRLTAKGPEVQ